MTDFLPRQNQWSRCHACGYCNHITWHDSNPHSAGTYEVTGCKVCRYRWSKSVLIQSLVNRMKMEFKRESGKNVFGPEEPIKATLELFRSGHCPEVIRECYKVAEAVFMDTFVKMWARSLQSKALSQ